MASTSKRSALSIAGAILIVSVAAAPVFAQDKNGGTQKILLDNDKVTAMELRYKPGEGNSNVPRNARVVRAITSGTLMRTYPDGKTEKIVFKAGEVRFNPAASGEVKQYTTKNIGKGTLVLYLVVLK